MICAICDQLILNDPATVVLTDGSRMSVHVDCFVEMIAEPQAAEAA